MFLIPGTPLTLLAGILFGPFFGTLYTILGATLGAWCAFMISRFARGSFVTKKSGAIAGRLSAYDAKIKENGFVTVLFLRLVPLFPFNVLNFALGLSSVPMKTYVLATCIGIIPGTTAYVFFGDALARLSILHITGAVLAVLGISIVGHLLMKHFHKTV
jgi:uncharacterized membrane protein YdjX (TVP38/TMEM64 family)